MDANEDSNEVGLHDRPRIADMIKEWTITERRMLVRDKSGKTVEMHDDVLKVGDRIASWLGQIYELVRADRELLTKFIDERSAFERDKTEFKQVLEEMPDA